MTVIEQLIECAEILSVTENSDDLEAAEGLFRRVLDVFCLTYFNPGEPEIECEFCDRNRALPGAYDVCDTDDVDMIFGPDVYWARVWATRALAILQPNDEDCCEKRTQLLDKLGV